MCFGVHIAKKSVCWLYLSVIYLLKIPNELRSPWTYYCEFHKCMSQGTNHAFEVSFHIHLFKWSKKKKKKKKKLVKLVKLHFHFYVISSFLVDVVSGVCDCDVDCITNCTTPGVYWDYTTSSCASCPSGH